MALRIVLVGGAGFIGSRLATRLIAAGHSVRIADRSPSAAHPALWQAADVTDPASLRAALADTDLVYNLAAEHGDTVRPLSRYSRVNVDGARNLCAAATASGVARIVFVSSVAVYGPSAVALDETAPLAPVSEYGRSKVAAEAIYRAWQAEAPARELAMLRPTVVFGETNRGNLHALFRAIARGRFRMVGAGRQVKSIAYVENVAAALEFIAGRGPGVTVFNYVDLPAWPVAELIGAVGRQLGRSTAAGVRVPYSAAYLAGAVADAVAWVTRREFTLSRQRVRKFVQSTWFSADAIRAAGFVPPVALEEGLQRTLAFEFGAPKPE